MWKHIIVWLTALGLPTATLAQLPESILTNYVWERNQSGDPFGSSAAGDVAVTPDGSRMVFSSKGNLIPPACGSTIQGAIYIYDYDFETDVWVLNDQFKNCSYINFGQSVSISDDGSTIAVGVNTAGFQNSGAAFVYEEINGDWTLTYNPTDPDNILGLPADLSDDGNLLIKVAPDQLGSYFTISRRSAPGVWAQEFFQAWTPLGPSNLNFNALASIDGDWAAINVNGAAGERLRMYWFDGSAWVVAQDLPYPPSGTPGSGPFASDVEIDGDRMILGVGDCCGAPGIVRIYELDSMTNLWSQVFEAAGAANDNLGFDVDILGDRAIAARAFPNDALLYSRIEGEWAFDQEIDTAITSAEAGRCVAIMDRGVLVGGSISVGTVRATIDEYGAPEELCSFTDDFEGLSEIPPTYYAFERVCSLQYVDGSALVLEREESCPEYAGVTSALGDVIVGDFDVSIDWDMDPVKVPFNGQFTIPIALTIYGGASSTLEMRIERDQVDTLLDPCQPSPAFHKAWDRVAGASNCASSNAPTSSLAASYRIQREGTTWRAFFKEPDDVGWTQLRTATLTDAPVRFAIEAFGNVGGTKARVDNLSVDIANCALCPPDLNGDDVVNGADLAALLANWAATSGPADLNQDQTVNGADLASLLAAWGDACGG